MYLISFEGWEMKARTEQDVRHWLQTNKVDAAFSWANLHRDGHVDSFCGRWEIFKTDEHTAAAADWVENYAWLGGTLVSLKPID